MIFWSLAAAVAAVAPQAGDDVAAGLVALREQSGADARMRCTDTGEWCVSLAEEAGSPLVIRRKGKEVGRWISPEEGADDQHYAALPGIYPLPGGPRLRSSPRSAA